MVGIGQFVSVHKLIRDNVDEELWGTGHLFFFLAEEEASNVLSIGREKLNSRDSSLLAYGSREDIGGWELHIDSTVHHYEALA